MPAIVRTGGFQTRPMGIKPMVRDVGLHPAADFAHSIGKLCSSIRLGKDLLMISRDDATVRCVPRGAVHLDFRFDRASDPGCRGSPSTV
jgi:hypothetical protein